MKNFSLRKTGNKDRTDENNRIEKNPKHEHKKNLIRENQQNKPTKIFHRVDLRAKYDSQQTI